MGVFSFKRFSIRDDGATMKVGTDGVLLGAWADIDNSKSILDIGTGTGIIALMMAQRTGAKTRIDAIELLKQDAIQAANNVTVSPWHEKISVIHISLQDFHPEKKYDLIVCNPPFFSKSLLPPDEARSSARHDSQLNSDDLIKGANKFLNSSGKLCIVLPTNESDTFILKASTRKIFLHRLTRFFTRIEKPQERSLMEFGLTPQPFKEDSLVLYESGNQWTEEYRSLTQAFYLDR